MDKELLDSRINEVNKIIFSFLPEKNENISRITGAMEYSVKAGGKRIRPILMQEAYRLFCHGKEESVLLHKFMAAIEFIHSYSLCHDDLPAMDNDTLRRGKPSTWAQYDEAFGILAGDALLNYAFELITEELDDCPDMAELRRGARALNVLAKKAGIYGMIGGQCIDVYSEKDAGFKLDLDRIIYIHKNKTSALLEASLMIGAILAGANKNCIEAMEEVAENVGFAFQIRDDILDVTSTDEELGKPAGSDAKNNKVTYVTLKGLEESQKDVEKYTDKAVDILNELPYSSDFLNELVLWLAGRKK